MNFKVSFISFILFCATNLWSQNNQQLKLEREKEKLVKEINETKELLKLTKDIEKKELSYLEVQIKNIHNQKKMLNLTQYETNLLSQDIQKNTLKLNKMIDEINFLKSEYSKLILKSYKSKSKKSRLLFLLSSNDFTQAYKRIQYLNQYASFTKAQGEEIILKSQELEAFNLKLGANKNNKLKKLNEIEIQKKQLEEEKREQEYILQNIKKDKKKFITDISRKISETKAIDYKINKLIQASIAAANKKSKEKRELEKKENIKKGKPLPVEVKSTGTNKIELTKEDELVSNSFRSNKGKLPWPVERGFVSLVFGNQPHPLESSIIIKSNSVEITTDAGSIARAVFEGEVSSIQKVGENYLVIIQHGDYFSVYQNIVNLLVKKGEKVNNKEKIGTIDTNESTGLTAIKFSVFYNNESQNPANWLYKM
jgi:septal ring factor EnvC (AmiA/AmiB activator)